MYGNFSYGSAEYGKYMYGKQGKFPLSSFTSILEATKYSSFAFSSLLQKPQSTSTALQAKLETYIWRKERSTPSQNWIKEETHE
jgi:hypothetical protein